MNRLFAVPLLSAATLVLAPLAHAQDEAAKRQLATLERVQAALHTAEDAQLALLQAPEGSTARLAVDRAVAHLRAARDALRNRLGGKAESAGGDLAARPKAGKRPALPRPDRKAIETAVERGLAWLHRHQDQNGKWDSDGFMKHDRQGVASDGPGNPVHDVGATGLALLAFLGAGNTTKAGKYQNNVLRAVKWLRSQQGPNGLFGTNASHDFIYDHAIAAFAMCEAYGLSKDELLKSTAQKGINYLEMHRNPYACWRYQPRDNDNDSSVTGWCLKAYRSAHDFGLQVNDQALKIVANFLDELTDPATGRLGYTKRGERSSRHPGDHATRFPIEKGESLTALGLASRFTLGQTPNRVPIMRLAATTMLAQPPSSTDKGAIDHYYWFHGTQGMSSMGGRFWDNWSRALGQAALSTQRQDGSFRGSWDSRGVWGEDGGRVYATSLMVLSLEFLRRHQRLVRDK